MVTWEALEGTEAFQEIPGLSGSTGSILTLSSANADADGVFAIVEVSPRKTSQEGSVESNPEGSFVPTNHRTVLAVPLPGIRPSSSLRLSPVTSCAKVYPLQLKHDLTSKMLSRPVKSLPPPLGPSFSRPSSRVATISLRPSEAMPKAWMMRLTARASLAPCAGTPRHVPMHDAPRYSSLGIE